MDLPKKVTDTLTAIAFFVSVGVAALAVTGLERLILLVAISYAFQWSLDKNVSYGTKLAYAAMQGEEEE